MRANRLSITSSATTPSLNAPLYSGINIQNGEFSLQFGLETIAAFETELDSNGNFGATLGNTINSRFKMGTAVEIEGTLPLMVQLDGTEQPITLIFSGEEVKVDFSVCTIANIFLPILGKLGALTMAPSNILGQQGFSGLSFFSDDGLSLDDLFPDVGDLFGGVLEAKNELFHYCAEVAITGEVAMSIEDAMAMIYEEVVGTADPCAEDDVASIRGRRKLLANCTEDNPCEDDMVSIRRRRELEGRSRRASRGSRYERGKRRKGRGRPWRARHLSHNKYIRPRRLRSREQERAQEKRRNERPVWTPEGSRRLQYDRRLQDTSDLCDAASDAADFLLDLVDIEGGYDGTKFYVRLAVDISKRIHEDDMAELLSAPLNMFGEVSFMQDLFGSDTNDTDVESSFDFSSSASASARAAVLFGFEQGEDESFLQILTFNTSQVASRSFVEFEDLSAKFLLSSSFSGDFFTLPGGAASVVIEDASAALGFGLGMNLKCNKIYFPQIVNMGLTMRQLVSWDKSE